jgi:hypothetical protein
MPRAPFRSIKFGEGDHGQTMPNKTVAFGLNLEQPDDTYSLGGDWAVGTQNVTSTKGSRARLNFQAAKVYHVLSGTGTVTVSIPGEPDKTITVSGTPNAYQLVDMPAQERKTMTLTYGPAHLHLRLSLPLADSTGRAFIQAG